MVQKSVITVQKILSRCKNYVIAVQKSVIAVQKFVSLATTNFSHLPKHQIITKSLEILRHGTDMVKSRFIEQQHVELRATQHVEELLARFHELRDDLDDIRDVRAVSRVAVSPKSLQEIAVGIDFAAQRRELLVQLH